MTYEQSMMNAGQRYFSEPVVFAARQSYGLVYVIEYCEADWGEEREQIEHGPFNDLSDAYIECGRPAVWVLE